MNESAACDVLLVRAVETADTADAAGAPAALLAAEDRRYAGRAAHELAHWQAAERGAPVDAGYFLAQRARLLRAKLAERAPALERAARALRWPGWIDIALPLAMLPAGALLEQVADRRHVNIIAFPLLAIVLWNLAVYGVLGAAWLRRAVAGAGARRGAAPGEPPAWRRGLRGAFAALVQRRPGALRGAAGAAFGRYARAWGEAGAALLGWRIARVLHLAAAAFAGGAVAGLYLRGLVLEYRAGWESTFLDASAVHAILAACLGPAARLLGTSLPSPDALAALRFGPGVPGENAARWIHLYAVTVALAVIGPRLLLAALAGWRARRRSQRFALDLDQPYFRRLLAPLAQGARRLRVVPYAYTPDEAAQAGLRTIAGALLGDDADAALRPVVAFGAEDSAGHGIAAADPAVGLTVALFGLAATPEREHHGVFLERLGAAAGAGLAVLVDESAYRRRVGGLAGGAARIAERSQAWHAFCAVRGVAVACVDLAAPDLARLERDLAALPGRAAA